jgi:hypothetical protein
LISAKNFHTHICVRAISAMIKILVPDDIIIHLDTWLPHLDDDEKMKPRASQFLEKGGESVSVVNSVGDLGGMWCGKRSGWPSGMWSDGINKKMRSMIIQANSGSYNVSYHYWWLRLLLNIFQMWWHKLHPWTYLTTSWYSCSQRFPGVTLEKGSNK